MAIFNTESWISKDRNLEQKIRDNLIKQTLQVPINDQYTTQDKDMKTTQSGELPIPYQTVEWEGRKDKQGNLEIYKLPPGDLGGTFEIAGINDKYHPEAFKEIASLPPEQRARAAAEYIQGYTAPLVLKLPKEIQPFTQDLAFNRGLGGATKYLQQGLNSLGQKVLVDGAMGPKTLSAISNVSPRALMQAASQAQLDDEYKKAEIDPRRKKFLNGLENRIRNRFSILGNV